MKVKCLASEQENSRMFVKGRLKPSLHLMERASEPTDRLTKSTEVKSEDVLAKKNQEKIRGVKNKL